MKKYILSLFMVFVSFSAFAQFSQYDESAEILNYSQGNADVSSVLNNPGDVFSV